ncbi:hypothetical protein BB561_002864 [Smittium simulii]|uniref:Uncharacterized protein n=1 Tax=Smittium simulii TaxID=133385 RepID=A0A2T9YNW6_9FUNG|nr:hypothetical protein BB561_002864 [Smittium simulii]
MIFKSRLPQVQMPNTDIATYVFSKAKSAFSNSAASETFALHDEHSGQSLNIAELEHLSTMVASGLRNKLKMQSDDTLMLFSANSANFVTTMFGTLMLGGVVTFANPAYTSNELSHQLNNSTPKFIAATEDTLQVAKDAIKMSSISIPEQSIIIINHNCAPIGNTTTITSLYDHRPFNRFTFSSTQNSDSKFAFLPYSSGTTGLSKGVILTHRNIVSNIIQTNIFDKLNGWHSDMNVVHRYLGVLPWYHIYGLVVCLLSGLSNGVGVVCLPKFEMRKYLETTQKHKITFAHLVPPILINLVNDPIVKEYDISSLKHAMTAAAPIGKELMLKLNEKFPSIKIIKLYGVTESSPTICAAPNGTSNIESNGILTCNQEAMVISDEGNALGPEQVGELLFRGPNIMKGYLNNEKATRDTIDKNGFLHTGDVGYIDKEGHVFIVDRKKELIKYKGFQVPPAELEALLLGHQDVLDCAVIGIYDDTQATELPKAFITLKQQNLHKTESEKKKIALEIQRWVAEKVVSYKRLRGGVQVIQSIPKSNAGKILRRVLREQSKNEKTPSSNMSNSETLPETKNIQQQQLSQNNLYSIEQQDDEQKFDSEELLNVLLDVNKKSKYLSPENQTNLDVLQNYISSGTYAELETELELTLINPNFDNSEDNSDYMDEIEKENEKKLVKKIVKLSNSCTYEPNTSTDTNSDSESGTNSISETSIYQSLTFANNTQTTLESFDKNSRYKDFYPSQYTPLILDNDIINIDVNESSSLRRRSTVRDVKKTITSNTLGFKNSKKLKKQKAKRILLYSPLVGATRAQTLSEVDTEYGDLTATLKGIKSKGSCFWLDILLPSELEVKVLSKAFKIHPLTVEDILENEDSIRSKCEMYTGYYFVVLDLVDFSQYDSQYLMPSVTYIIVTRFGVISFHNSPTCRRLHILRWIYRLMKQTCITPDWINYAIMDDITDQIVPVVRSVELEVEAIDELVLILSSMEQSDMLLRIGTVRKRLMFLLRILQGKADVIRILTKRFGTSTATGLNPQPFYNSNMKNKETSTFINSNSIKSGTKTPIVDYKTHDINLYLADILDHIITMSQNAAHLEAVLSRAYSNYLAKISLELTESSNRTNDVIAKLSILASVLIPLNLITGLWGMNVPVPGQDSEDLAWFLGIVLVIVSFAVFMIFICVRMGLI